MSIYSSKLTSGGTCCLKVRICLAEKNLDWVDHLDSRNGDHSKPENLKLNPNSVVPALVHEEMAISYSSVIMEYIDV
jgi:glutathione S-transferase